MKQKVVMNPKQLMNKLYNNAWQTGNWTFTPDTKKTAFVGISLIAGAMLLSNFIGNGDKVR